MSYDPIPVAVIGAGNMGANHVRVYDELPMTDLVAVVEPDDERARDLEEAYDMEVLETVASLPTVEAVSICVPNHLHRSVAVECAEMGLDLLVEKPLALTIEDARAIVEAADENDVILQVGHIERFNPAVTMLEEILENEEVIAIEAHRLGPFNEHLTTESVVFDLMIHDVDVVQALITSSLRHTSAFGTAPRSDDVDHAVALFKFDNGALATTTASHVTHGKIRTMDVTTTNAYISLDYQQQDIVVQRRGIEQTEPFLNRGGYRTETITESPYIRTREPLKIELEHFADCCRNRSKPRVPGSTGIRAVELATTILEEVQSA